MKEIKNSRKHVEQVYMNRKVNNMNFLVEQKSTSELFSVDDTQHLVNMIRQFIDNNKSTLLYSP